MLSLLVGYTLMIFNVYTMYTIRTLNDLYVTLRQRDLLASPGINPLLLRQSRKACGNSNNLGDERNKFFIYKTPQAVV